MSEKKEKIDLTKKPKKSLIKKEKKENPERKVDWDWEKLAEQEKERLENPKTKIDEPKTPYEPCNPEGDKYLEKLNEIRNVKSTKDLLNDVTEKLNSKNIRKNSEDSSNDQEKNDDDDYVEVEVCCPDGTIKKELKKKDYKNSKEFLRKRKQAYENEFSVAKKKFKESEENEIFSGESESESEKEFEKETLKNTLYNKFSGKVPKEKVEKLLDKKNS